MSKKKAVPEVPEEGAVDVDAEVVGFDPEVEPGDTAIATIPKFVPPPTEIDKKTEETFRKYEEVIPPDVYIQILTTGNFAKLQESEAAKFLFIHAVRKGLDPWRLPFMFIVGKDGKRILYPRKEASAQLRHKNKITVRLRYAGALRLEYNAVVLKNRDQSERMELVPCTYDKDVYEAVWEAVDDKGTVLATEIGTADLNNVVGNERKNAIMACYTRGKRRVILDATGLGDDDPQGVADPAEQDEDVPESVKRKALKAPIPPGPKRQVPRVEASTDAPSVQANQQEGLPSFAIDEANPSTPPTSEPTEVPTKSPSRPPRLAQA